MKKLLTLLCIISFVSAHAQCNLNIGWTSSVNAGNITFTNASTGVPPNPQFAWLYDGQSSSMENPTFPYDSTIGQVCFAIYSLDIACDDSICGPLNNSSCNLILSWTSSVNAGNITFTNTSTGMPSSVSFAWLYDGQASSMENPTFPYDSTLSEVCFAIYDLSGGNCDDSICGPVGSPPCALNISWTSCVGGGNIGFNNTSSGMPTNASFAWLYNGQSSSLEDPLFTYDSSATTVCFAIYDLDNSACQDSICGDINDTCACNLNINWVSAINGDSITFYNTSTGEPSNTSYAWLYNGQGSSQENPTFVYDSTISQVCFAINDLTGMNCDDSICGGLNPDSTANVITYEDLEFKIYPNPASTELNVVISNGDSDYVIQIIDLTGRIVYNATLINNSTSIDLYDLDQGSYLLHIYNQENPEQRSVKKFIKQ